VRKDSFLIVPAVKTAGYYQSSPAGTEKQRRWRFVREPALIASRYARSGQGAGGEEDLARSAALIFII